MPEPVFYYTHRVTYAECAPGNHVYYSRYLDLLEAARGEFFRQLSCSFSDWQAKDVIFPVIECRVRYKAPARYDDVVTIEVRLTTMEGVRLGFAYRVLSENQRLLAEAETLHVCTGCDEKLKRLPQELRLKLKPLIEPRLSIEPGG
jgi:acyl-CoA thioester hydrolase